MRTIKRSRGGWVYAGLLVLLYLVYTAARSWVLLRNTGRLLRVAERFPRDYWVGPAGGRRLTFAVLGDSTALGQGASAVRHTCAFQIAMAEAGRGYRVHVVNLAVSGSLLHQVLTEQAPQLARWHPGLVAISVGANDATHRTPLAQYQRDLGSLLALAGAGGATSLVATTPDMEQTPALPWPFAWETGRRAWGQNALLRLELARNREHYVDLYNRGKLIYRADPSLYASDFFHPSDKGYAVWAKLFCQGMRDEG